MSAGRALPVKAPVKKTAVPRALRDGGTEPDNRDMSEFVPQPIPADPAQRAALLAAIDKGIAEARRAGHFGKNSTQSAKVRVPSA
ncbi:MAG: hypothetical protein U0787_18340 [Polyangia bacterium]